MKFPDGISDYYKIITENYFYLDRTDSIRQIEEYGQSLLFLPPRRFGKSLGQKCNLMAQQSSFCWSGP